MVLSLTKNTCKTLLPLPAIEVRWYDITISFSISFFFQIQTNVRKQRPQRPLATRLSPKQSVQPDAINSVTTRTVHFLALATKVIVYGATTTKRVMVCQIISICLRHYRCFDNWLVIHSGRTSFSAKEKASRGPSRSLA